MTYFWSPQRQFPACIFDMLSKEGSQFAVVGIAGPGELLGVAEVFCGTERNGYTCAAGDVSLFSVDREDFFELLSCNPFLLKKILGILSHKMNMDEASVYSIIFTRGPVNAPKDSGKLRL